MAREVGLRPRRIARELRGARRAVIGDPEHADSPTARGAPTSGARSRRGEQAQGEAKTHASSDVSLRVLQVWSKRPRCLEPPAAVLTHQSNFAVEPGDIERTPAVRRLLELRISR
jgi:hypothetical protein